MYYDLVGHAHLTTPFLDPVPLLESAVTQQQKLMNMQDLTVENSKLRETLDEYTKEFAQVKNQGNRDDVC